MKTLRDRLIAARLESGLTQGQVAERAGMSQAAYQKLESGNSSRSRFLSSIARTLGVTSDWLETGEEQDKLRIHEPTAPYGAANATRHVPELNWEQAAMWAGVHDLNVNTSNAKYWACPVPCGEHTFALRVKSDAMAPHYPQGLLIYVDPDVGPVSGKKVVAAHRGATEAVFRQYIEDGGREILKAMNTNWPDPYLSIGDDCRIVGTVIFAGEEM